MPPKLKYEDVKIYFDSLGCKLISTTYTTNKKPLEYLCKCGNPEVQTNRLDAIKRGIRCGSCRVNRMKNTNMERHGYEFVSQRPEMKDKACAGMLKYVNEKKYKIEEVKTLFNKFGCELLETSYIDNKTLMKFKCVCGKDGVISLNHFIGGERCNHIQCMESRKKATNMKKFGKTWYTQTEVYKENYITHSLATYGVAHPLQNSEVQAKNELSGLRFKNYKMPSGKIVRIQGYENRALDELLNSYSEEQIVSGRKNMPEIWWHDKENIKHRYFCDFFLPHINTIVEVKSTWTLKKAEDIGKIEGTKKAANAAGYDFKLMVYKE